MVYITKKQIGVNGKNPDVSNNYGRNFAVSPLFNYSNTATIAAVASAPTNIFVVDVEQDSPTGYSSPVGFRYAPFNNCRIVNNSTQDVIVYVNSNRFQGVLVPHGVAITIDNSAIKGFNSLIVENQGSSTISASQINCLFWKDNVTSDTVLKRLHNKLFSGSGN